MIDPIILASERKKAGFSESNDSSAKKLIYQVPFTEVDQLSIVLKELENQILIDTYLDIEVNSLEDAYLNIAKEEEKLLRNMIEHQSLMRKRSTTKKMASTRDFKEESRASTV